MWTSPPSMIWVNITLVRPGVGWGLPLWSGPNANSWDWEVDGRKGGCAAVIPLQYTDFQETYEYEEGVPGLTD